MKFCKQNHEYDDSQRQCPECRKISKAKWELENAERVKSNNARWKLENAERRKISNAKWRRENTERQKANKARWQAENKEQYLANKATYQKQRRAADPLFKLSMNLRILISKSLKQQGYSKSSKTQSLLGADFETVILHLEETKINNYGLGAFDPDIVWHIDHIIPCSSATTEAELIALQHYTNLQYLTQEDNLAKSDSFSWNV